MKRSVKVISISSVIAFFTTMSLPGASPEERRAEQVPAAMKKLRAWETTGAEKKKRLIHIVYWTPADRAPAPGYERRLSQIFLNIQKYYAAEMKRIGFGPRTFQLDTNRSGMPKIHLVKGKFPYSRYQKQSGSEIRKECVPTLAEKGIDADRETVVIFCNMSNWDEKAMRITQNSPYYAFGTHQKGTAWQVDSPILNLEFLNKKEPKIHDGEYSNISIGKYNSIFIGGIAHELGHALGLPHNRATREEAAAYGTALMGNGNFTYGEQMRGEGKGSFITLAHGLKLASHPSFSGSVKGFDRKLEASLTDISFEEAGKGFKFKGKIKGSPEIYAVLGYMDPEGGNDYDATTCTAVPDAEGNFILEADAFKANTPGEFCVVAVAVNGSATSFGPNDAKWRFPYQVNKEGKADISIAKIKLAVTPWYQAMVDGTALAEETALTDWEKSSPLIREIHRRLSDKKAGKPLAIAANATTVALSTLPWKEARVGWREPAADVLPEPTPFIAAGEIFAGGLFAHTPSRYVYELPGEWKKLSGRAGLLMNKGGSVIFRIFGDGRELWSSPLLKDGKTVNFDLSLAGVKELTLETDPGDDGTSSDWGLWLDPQLSR